MHSALRALLLLFAILEIVLFISNASVIIVRTDESASSFLVICLTPYALVLRLETASESLQCNGAL